MRNFTPAYGQISQVVQEIYYKTQITTHTYDMSNTVTTRDLEYFQGHLHI